MEYGLRDSKLPPTVVIDRERRQAEDELHANARKLQTEYKRLKGFPDLAPLPPLEGITQEWLKTAIAKKMEEVQAMPGITENERAQRMKQWYNIKQGANLKVSIINKIRQKYGDAVKFDELLDLPYIEAQDAKLASFCARAVPQEATEHHRRLLAVTRAVSELRFWEFNNNVKRFPLEVILQWDNLTIATKWATGEILEIDPDSVPPYLRDAVIMRQESERQNIL